MVRFLDSSVFLHAFLRPKRRLTGREKWVKDAAKNIISSVEGGEQVCTTVVHVSEVANIVESRLGLLKSIGLVAWIADSENIEVFDVSFEEYTLALAFSRKYMVSVNDALAYLVMREHGIKTIYTFDRHFRNFKDIEVLPRIV